MNDNDVLKVLIPLLKNGLSKIGMPDVLVLQSYQPTQQGAPTQAAIFIHKIDTLRYGFKGKKQEYNEDTGTFDVTESFWRLPRYQIDARAPQNPEDLSLPTSSDLVEMAADVLQLSSTRQELLESGIGIERITNVRNVRMLDERDQHVDIPSFDFVLQYRKSYTSTADVVDKFEFNHKRV